MNSILLFAFLYTYRVMSVPLLKKEKGLGPDDYYSPGSDDYYSPGSDDYYSPGSDDYYSPVSDYNSPGSDYPFHDDGYDVQGDTCDSHDDCNGDSFCFYWGSCSPCEDCWFDYDGVDATCGQCTPLCNEPFQFPTCPMCESQEECDALYPVLEEEEEKPYPVCTDGSDRCQVSDECHEAFIDYVARLNDWFTEWFNNNPGATEMPSLDQWEPAGYLPCDCLNNQAQCIINAKCYSDEDVQAAEDLEFSMSELCLVGMGCDQSQCGWASHEPNEACPDLLSIQAKGLKRVLQKRNTQRKMRSKYNQKKKFETVKNA